MPNEKQPKTVNIIEAALISAAMFGLGLAVGLNPEKLPFTGGSVSYEQVWKSGCVVDDKGYEEYVLNVKAEDYRLGLREKINDLEKEGITKGN